MMRGGAGASQFALACPEYAGLGMGDVVEHPGLDNSVDESQELGGILELGRHGPLRRPSNIAGALRSHSHRAAWANEIAG